MNHKVVRSNTVALNEVKQQVLNLLDEAEQKKGMSYPDAITILFNAAKLLPKLAADEKSGSDRKITQDRSTQEIIYISKRGNILYDLKEYEKAQECYAFIKQKLPNNTEVHKSLGDCLRKLRKFPEASAMYERAFAVYEKDEVADLRVKAGLLNSRGLNYMEQGKCVEAKNDFEAAVKISTKNPLPLYLCNKGYVLYALNEKDEALKSFTKATELVINGQLNGLTRQNLEYIKKTLEEFVVEIDGLKNVSLKKQDSFIEARELDYIKAHLNALTLDEEEDEEHREAIAKAAFTVVAAKRLKTTKLTIQKIQKDQKLFEYYDGFLFALAKSYSTAVVINSGQEIFHTNTSKEIDILASAIQLMPLVGTELCDNLEDLAKYIKGPKVMKTAANISKFATSQSMFLEIVQDALVEVIEVKQKEIKSQEDNDLDKIILPKLASKYQKIINRINKLKGNGSEMLYGERNETPLQRLGYMTANTLMSEHVASGAIFNEELAIRIPKDEKKKRLVEIAKKLFDTSLDRIQQPQQLQQPQYIELSNNIESRGSCENCRMF